MTFWEGNQELLDLVSLLSLKEILIGVWNDYKMGKVFISADFIPESPYIFTMSVEDSKPNVMMIKALKKYNFWRNFLDNYSLRSCLF